MEINFLGIGSAWNIKEDNTSAYIKKDNKMILIDCGETIARNIIENNILENISELYILISHTHSDHIGSLGTLLFYSTYNKKILNRIVLPDDEEYENNLKEYLRLVEISSEIEYVDSSFLKKKFNLKTFKFLKATHVESLPCYCFVFEDEEDIIYYSADNSNIDYIKHYIQFDNSTIYTEVCNNSNLQNEHLYLPYLEKTLSMLERKRIFLMHIDEFINLEDLINKGFNIPETQKKEGKNYGRKNKIK